MCRFAHFIPDAGIRCSFFVILLYSNFKRLILNNLIVFVLAVVRRMWGHLSDFFMLTLHGLFISFARFKGETCLLFDDNVIISIVALVGEPHIFLQDT